MNHSTAESYHIDRAILQTQTAAELTLTLKCANIAGRSKATTKAQKIDLLLRAYFGYIVFSDGSIRRDMESADFTLQAPATAPEAPAAPKKARKEPTRAALAQKAQIYGWDVVNYNGIYIVQHGRAKAMNHYMVKSTSLPALARRLSKLIAEWQQASIDCTVTKFYDRYFHNDARIN